MREWGLKKFGMGGKNGMHNSLGQGTGVLKLKGYMPHPFLQLKEVESLLSHPSQCLCPI